MNQYGEAARVLEGVLAKKGSIKTLALRKEIRNKRFVTALVSETVRHKAAIDAILDKSGLRPTLRGQVRDAHLLYLLLYDLLFGRGITGGGQVKKVLKSHEAALREAAAGVPLPEPSPAATAGNDAGDAAARFFPRYARVNTLKTDVASVVAALSEGGEQGGSAAAAAVLSKDKIQEDAHIPHLLALPPGTDLHAHPLVKSGALVLQDKASCFSAEALLGDVCHTDSQPVAVGDVIDACAAPGNKTSHLAALLHEAAAASTSTTTKGKGKAKKPAKARHKPRVFALDRDADRLAILRRRVVDTMGAGEIVVPLLQDFLALDPADPRLTKVRAILLDPSCSGSGMVASVERQYEASAAAAAAAHARKGNKRRLQPPPSAETVVAMDESGRNWRAGVKEKGGGGVGGGAGPTARLKALAQFQYRALTKAFSFPQVQRVVYSTCSIHAEEDEMVVRAALADEARKLEEDSGYRAFELKSALPGWPRRGLCQTPDGRETGLTEEQAACLARTDPRQDKTNGFFVARFERQGDGSVLLSPPSSVVAAATAKAAGKAKGKDKAEAKQQPQQGIKKKRAREADDAEEEDDRGGSEEEDHEGKEHQQSAAAKSRAQKRRERRKRAKQQQQGGEEEGGGNDEGEED